MNVNDLLEEGRRSLKTKNYYTAIDYFKQAYELEPDNPEVHYYLGITYGRMQRYEKAIENLELVLKSELAFIHKVHVKMILGYIYTIQEKYDRALEFFRSVVKSGIETAQAYAAIGYIMHKKGEVKEALMNLYRAIEIDPKNANAHNSLGFILGEENINLEEALEECRKAVDLDPDNPAYLDSLGWVYYKMGKIPHAKSYIAKALKLAPENEEIKKHLETIINS